jgi:hypothetical protein
MRNAGPDWKIGDYRRSRAAPQDGASPGRARPGERSYGRSYGRRRQARTRTSIGSALLLLVLSPLVIAGMLLSSRSRAQGLTLLAALAVAVVVLPLTAYLGIGLVRSFGASLTPQAQPAATPAPASTPEPCRFVAGFAALRDLVPEVTGECLEWEQVDPVSGDTSQRTTTGLMAWRKVDNATGFTDGQGTWLNGPNGLVYRPNTIRFPWEANPTSLPVVAEHHPSIGSPGAILPAQRVITYYGNPLSPAMGVLGQRNPDQMLAALEGQAQQYAAADPTTPVKLALHLVSAVATDTPGPDGMYRRRSSAEEIERLAQLAESKGHLLILDIQPGRSAVRTEVEAILPYLERPYVHLALDPEWAMLEGQVPGRTYGTMDAVAVNEVVQMLARLVSRHKLPPKILIVHRFRDDMLTNYRAIRPDPRVQVVIAMDGVGAQLVKTDVYRRMVKEQPVQFAGLKIFYTQDIVPYTPRQALNLDPKPHVIIYQ